MKIIIEPSARCHITADQSRESWYLLTLSTHPCLTHRRPYLAHFHEPRRSFSTHPAYCLQHPLVLFVPLECLSKKCLSPEVCCMLCQFPRFSKVFSLVSLPLCPKLSISVREYARWTRRRSRRRRRRITSGFVDL